MGLRRALLAFGLVLALSPCPALAQPSGVRGYEVVSIGVVPERDSSSVRELDDFGRVLGRSGNPFSTPLVWANGELLIVPTPEGYERPQVSGIGDGGVVVGFSTRSGEVFFYPVAWTATHGAHLLPLLPGTGWGDADCVDGRPWPDTRIGGYCYGGGSRATIWERGVPRQLAAPSSSVGDLNAAGEAVGSASNQQGVRRPVLWLADGHMIDIGGEPANANGGASGINDLTEVVAFAQQIGPFHWHDGVRTILPAIGQCSASPYAINNSGIIAGESNPDPRCSNGQEHAVVWERFENTFMLFDLNDWIPRHDDLRLVSAKDINDAGQMAVFGEYDDGRERGFLVTPYLFEMSNPIPGRAGQANTITVTGLQPGQRILLAWGLKEGAQKIKPDCPGGTLLIRDPHALPPVLADANGVATITMQVPQIARGRAIRLQAIAPAQCQISHTVTWVFE